MKKKFNLINALHIIQLYPLKIKLILINLTLITFISCFDKKENEKPFKTADTYNWTAAISSPKFYPIGNVTVDFGYASANILTSFDSGWGDTAGNFISGEKYKPAPKKVYIKYTCGANNFVYEGTLKLPKEKILAIFQEQSNKKSYLKSTPISHNTSNYFELIVGMAPGGWIRIWVRGNGNFNQVEILKAKLNGYEDVSSDEKFKIRNLKNWGKYFTYWQYHGIPYDAWEKNENEYKILYSYNCKNDNLRAFSFQSISRDGTFYPGDYLLDNKSLSKKVEKQKIPVQMTYSWFDSTKKISYDTFVIFPKNFAKIYTTPYFDKISQTYKTYDQILLETEPEGNYAKIYLIGKNRKELFLRFKAFISKSTIIGSGNYSKEVQYYTNL